jgi:hypothetical protein
MVTARGGQSALKMHVGYAFRDVTLVTDNGLTSDDELGGGNRQVEFRLPSRPAAHILIELKMQEIGL